MDGIFISYRRDDSAGYTGRLYDRLVTHFGAARVFMDVEGIEPGTDFVSAIEDAVGSCRVLIVIIGDEWTTVADGIGRRRLDDPNDFIRLETSAALKRGIRVVPVLVGGAVMPRVDELPEELHPLARRQAIEISHKQWDASTGELIRTLERTLDKNNGNTPSIPKEETKPHAAPLPVAAARSGWALPLVGGAAALALIGGLLWHNSGKRDEAFAPPARLPQVAVVTPPAEAKKAVAANEAPVTLTQPPAKAKPAAATIAPAAAPVPAPAVAVPTPPPTPPRVTVAKPLPKSIESRVEADTPIAPGPTESASAPPQLAVVPPSVSVLTTVKPGAAAVGGLPSRGESWTYRSSGKWPTSPKRNFQITVQSVADGVVTDALRLIDPAGGAGGAGDVRRSRGGKPDFVAWPELGIEFSPYLGGYGELSRLEAQSGFPTPELDSQWSQWHSKLKWLGQESVSVPAGTFNSHKVEVWSNRHASGTQVTRASEPVGVHYYVWYAPDVKRYVKMQRRIVAASGAELEKDVFEMVARAR